MFSFSTCLRSNKQIRSISILSRRAKLTFVLVVVVGGSLFTFLFASLWCNSLHFAGALQQPLSIRGIV